MSFWLLRHRTAGMKARFARCLTMLNPEFANLPSDLGGPQNEQHRRRLAAQFVQRRRGDIRHYLNADTLFPEREEKEESYQLSKEYKQFFDRVLRYARETVADQSGGRFHQRVRWWSALALLRALASSPAAAAATLRSRAASADAETTEEVDKIGRSAVLDLSDGETEEGVDVTPGADAEADDPKNQRRRLLEMARVADSLRSEKDWKILKASDLLESDPQGRLSSDRLLPLHPYRRIRRGGTAQAAPEGHRGSRHHRHTAASRARRAR